LDDEPIRTALFAGLIDPDAVLNPTAATTESRPRDRVAGELGSMRRGRLTKAAPCGRRGLELCGEALSFQHFVLATQGLVGAAAAGAAAAGRAADGAAGGAGRVTPVGGFRLSVFNCGSCCGGCGVWMMTGGPVNCANDTSVDTDKATAAIAVRSTLVSHIVFPSGKDLEDEDDQTDGTIISRSMCL